MEHDAIEFARCRDDTTLHTYGQSFDEIIEKLEIDCLEITMSKIPAGNYMFKVNNRNTRTRCELFYKLTIKAAKRSHWIRCDVFFVNSEHISNLLLIFLLPNLSR